MPDSSKYNPYNDYSEEWEKYERQQRNKDYWDSQREPLTPRPPVTPSLPNEVPDLPGFPNDNRNPGRPVPSDQFHTLGAADVMRNTNSNNPYYGQEKWDQAFAEISKLIRGTDKDRGGSYDYLKDIYANLQKGYQQQRAMGNFQFGNDNTARKNAGVSGSAGDVKFSGMTNDQATRLQSQASRQETMTAPANAARQSMFDALQSRIDKQLQLAGVQSEQSRELSLRKMIYEKQAGELKMQQMQDQIDTQYMNSIISTVGSTFANAYMAWNQKNNMAQYGSDYAKNSLQNSLGGFTNTWNTNYMPRWE